MTDQIVGRESELGSLCAFLDRRAEAPVGLVLEAEPGIGKSALWLAAVAAACERGFVLLSSRPAEAERGLAHVGLGDLIERVPHEVIAELSSPRRRALEIALLRDESADEAADHRALAVAVRDVLHLLGEQKPVVVAIDDVQWLDSSSASALTFALRRLHSTVRLVLARRLEPSGLEQSVDVERLRVGPLSVGALHRLLHDRFDQAFARQTLLRIHERSGGNPFFALELARVLDEDVDPLEPLPVPETLEELVRARLAGLPETASEALALASALGAPSESLLERAGVLRHVLDPAVEAHVVERERGVVRFTHPLLSSLLYKDLGGRRRLVHERIASRARDDERALRDP
jgi:AAA ATPase domain